jgi:excinuclease ABC subunit C
MDKIDYKAAPTASGIYVFTGKAGKVLYVGKAVNIRNRVKSYFKKVDNPRIRAMVDKSIGLKFIETDSEIEALILESQYIKKYKPRFNVVMRDDKQYFYVAITKEDFPKIFLTHQKKDKAEYIGPFTDGKAIRATLKLLRRIFPYCTCKQKHANYCLNYHIDNCLGYCCLKNKKESNKEYKKNVAAIKQILTGKKNILIKKLTKEMNQSAKKEKFEKSIQLRGQIEKLRRVFENARIIQETKKKDSKILKNLKKIFRLKEAPQRIEGYDISNIHGIFATASMIVFENGEPNKKEYKKFKIRISGRANDTAMLKEVLDRRFRHPEWPLPDLILIDGGKGQLNAAISALEEKDLSIPVISLTKDAQHKASHIFSSTLDKKTNLKDLDSEVKNLVVYVDAEAHRFAIKYYRELHARSLRK